MGLTQTSAPATEPVTRAEAKLHLKVDFTDDDDLIDGLIAGARQMAEAYTQRQFITATYTQTYSDFPGGYGIIQLERTPLDSISSITYYDTNGTQQTLSTDVYESVSNDTCAFVVLKPGQTWPSVQSDKYEAVTVAYTAGYGAATTDVPATARNGILRLVADMYHNRGDEDINTHQTAMALLDTVSVRRPAS